ncbi:MAG: hypothetical protein DU480_10180 [Nitrosomonas sp.]
MFYWVIEDCNLSIVKIDYCLIIDYRKDLSLLSGIEEKVNMDLGCELMIIRDVKASLGLFCSAIQIL